MNSAQIEIQIIAVIVAMACAIPGTFLVLRKMAMITDAISHAILPGIVVGFFITQDIASPFLVIMAAVTGLLTVVLVEFISKTGLVKEDTAIGLVFPALFSIGVLLIAKNADDIHIDVDAVLLGELAFAPFDRFVFNGIDLAPKALVVMGGILVISIILVIVFFKELKISSFDIELARALGFSPVIIHYVLMALTSLTTVGAFDAVGAVLVVALMIVPAATAYLLTNNLKHMIISAMGIGMFAALGGYWIANLLDASIAGSIATVMGTIFLFTFLLTPGKGLLSVMRKRKQQRNEFSLVTFLIHVRNHIDTENANIELAVEHLTDHFNWQRVRAANTIDFALRNNMIHIDDGIVALSEKGYLFVEEALNFISSNKNKELDTMKNRFLLFRG